MNIVRVSHSKIRKLISDSRSSLTDQEVFCSPEFGKYLTDIAEAISRRYKRHIRVKMQWDIDENAISAFTDDKDITINAGNILTRSLPTRPLRALSLIGMCSHELGHILYTDFLYLRTYMVHILAGELYPGKPDDMPLEMESAYMDMQEAMVSGDEAILQTVAIAAKNLANILEDAYIEARMCSDYPGRCRSGIVLNNVRHAETMPSILQQISKDYHPFAIVANLIIQYCKNGEVNNLGDYQGEYLETFEDCMAVIDDAKYDDDTAHRYGAVNWLTIRLWPYIKTLIEKTREEMAAKKSLEEAIKALVDLLDGEIEINVDAPDGESIAISIEEKPGSPKSGSALKSETAKAPPNGKVISPVSDEEREKYRKVIEEEEGRIPLEKTQEISGDGIGEFEYDSAYEGSGYPDAEKDMRRIIDKMALDRAITVAEQELSQELQAEAQRIEYGNAHRGISIKVRRMTCISERLVDGYKKVSPKLLQISKRLQRQIKMTLKEQKTGGKLNGLLIGRRLESRTLYRKDGRNFYSTRLPQDTELAVALLIDESGSMASCDRITHARATSIILHDFCLALDIPIAIYGHDEDESNCVNLYSYAEYDSVDQKDKYRIMGMSAREGNRDGAALRFVAERLVRRPEETKLLVLISDGQPAGTGYYGTAAEADLRGIKQEYSRKGIHLFAAAIGEDKPNIQRIYKDGFLDITNLESLPRNLSQLIIKYLR